MDKASFFILNVFLNSFLSFVTAAILIEVTIFLFRIRQGRISATLRMIPIIKLPLDLFLYDFTRWSYVHGVNPLNCEEGTRTLSVSFGSLSDLTSPLFLPFFSSIQMTTEGDVTFTVADIIGYQMRPLVLKVLAVIFVLITAFLLIKRFFQYRSSARSINSLEKCSEASCRKIDNASIASCINKRRTQILTSPSLTGSPFVTGLLSSDVYVPRKFSQSLSGKEYEAVIAHEMEHIRYKDSLVRFILDTIETLFWWVPTKWLHKRIEEGQEVGCDLNCKTYGVDPLDLASAICKSARHSINISDQILTLHLTKQTIRKRVDLLLQSTTMRFRKTRMALSFIAMGIAFLLILFGKYWTF